mmetsp:Transcript_56262/g.147946  ORF Transcript_56262/g.147946 Transcript_56262/m.147946 type:complete len:583 (-) Transcript_56262:70-1818(-)
MYRFFTDPGENGQRPPAQQTGSYDEFVGKVIVVDLAEINGQTEDFEGRAWLEARVRDKLPVGWDLEWQPDRTKDSDNPIALMQFADETTALLVRTHRTKNWLPLSIMRALMSEGFKKVGVGWDGPDKQKMQGTFNFQPVGIEDLSEIAKQKGLQQQGLKSLSDHFGYRMRKDSRVARSNWACDQLTQEQIRYAAEDAYFSYLLYDKVRKLPDPVVTNDEGWAGVNAGVLEIQPGWEEQGIVRRHDGLYCSMCSQGPMCVPLSVMSHMNGQKHRKKWDTARGIPEGAPVELSDEYQMHGIVTGDGINELKIGDFKCTICDAGPFNNLDTVDVHLKSKKHAKNVAPPPEPVVPDTTPKDPFASFVWNLPDYVHIAETELLCTLCGSKASAGLQMQMHLGGDKHAKRCRAAGKDELIFVKERERLEVMTSGRPVVRKDHRVPKADKAAAAGASSASSARPAAREEVDPLTGSGDPWARPGPGIAGGDDQQRLPPGWQAVPFPDEPGKEYYADIETQASQWERPTYVHGDWRRLVDPKGLAYWACTSPMTESFYESDPPWQRVADHAGRIYWSNQETRTRFFEVAP